MYATMKSMKNMKTPVRSFFMLFMAFMVTKSREIAARHAHCRGIRRGGPNGANLLIRAINSLHFQGSYATFLS